MSILDRFSLKGKVVLLTGGAGIYGRGLTRDVAESGAKLIIASRNVEALQKVADEENERGYDVSVEVLDQGDPASVNALCARLKEKFGRIDGLVNNAVARPMTGAKSMAEELEHSMRINATGMMVLTAEVGEIMSAQGSGSIVNIGSIMGMIGTNKYIYEGTGMKHSPDYFFHKGGMTNVTRFFAADLGPKGIRVNCLSPGGFFNHQDPVFVERYNKMTMMDRMAQDGDLGGSVVFLLSDASSYITGTNLPVDGGYTAK
jgi:NAD(P)-dependent dehydrogenase (short-subunit alcohol dehydrogenase family)